MVAELTEENEKLTLELNALKETSALQQSKLDMLTSKVVSAVDKKEYGITEQTNLQQLPIDTLMEMLSKLVVRKQVQDVSVEARVEELESRVTEMSMDIAKMTKKTLAYETGLEDIGRANCMEQVRDKVFELQLIAGELVLVGLKLEICNNSTRLNSFNLSIDQPTYQSINLSIK